MRLADIGLLIAPARVLDIDVGERFEAALPELSRPVSRSTSPCATRRTCETIVLTGDIGSRLGHQFRGR